MIFNSFSFIVLFPLVFLLYYIIPARYPKIRNWYLLIVSYALYVKWKPAYALVLLGVSLITYWGGRILQLGNEREALLVRNRRLVWLFALLALLPLFVFKYYNFINDSISKGFASIGIQVSLSGLNWAIPIGISFFTFQAVGYMLDVFYGRIEAERDIVVYLLFVSFFPSILSGPINKASLVLPLIKNMRPYFDYCKAVEGLKMILWGMFMKVVVADRVALYVNTVLDSYLNFTGTSCFVASILYTIQIYSDFAGYSLMAIGVGKTLGFELTENFRRPYFAVSVTDFWRRWHISLSTWLKDYVYIPLGGSRCSKIRNYWNILITFLVSGIWHGANWTFIVWGIWHGVFQIIEKAIGQQGCDYGWFGRLLKIIITFLIVNFAWLFFRMPTITDACGVIARVFDPALPLNVYVDLLPNLPFTIIGVSLLFLKDLRDEFFSNKFLFMDNKKRPIRWITYLLLLVLIMITGVFGADQFIYSNF